MSPEELLQYICNGARNSVQRPLGTWMHHTAAFHVFVETYRDKIRAKVRNCGDEDCIQDLLWEREGGFLLSKNPQFAIQYEAYGTGISRSPDYRVSNSTGTPFNVEARRIRESAYASRFQAWEKELKEAIGGTPSQVGLTLSVFVELTPDLLARLESQCNQIKEAILQKIPQANLQLDSEGLYRYPIPGFEDVMDILITKPQAKVDPTRTSYYGADLPVPNTQREFAKFGDIICDKLGQLRDGMPNLLAIGSQTVTHEAIDCEDAIENLTKLAISKDDGFFIDHGFGGATDFLAQLPKLSAIVFRSSYVNEKDRNFIWRNPNAAQPLDNQVLRFFKDN